MRELVNPLERAALFAKSYLPDNRIVPPELVLSLISQHLRTLGLVETQDALHREWENVASIPHKQSSQLALLVQRAVYKAGRFWDITVPSCHNQPSAKLTQQALDTEISTTIGSTPKLLEDKSPLPLEKEDDENFIKYDGDMPVEASLNQLIYYSTSRKKGADELLKAMCLTISSYSSNKVFCKKILDRIQITIDANKQTDLILCIKLLKEWISGAGNTLEPEILDTIQKFVDRNITPFYPKLGGMITVKTITKNPLAHLTGNTEKVDIGNLGDKLFTGDFDLTDLPPTELARQLTVWSYMRYYAIQRVELLDCAWEKPRLKHRAPNVVSMTTHFNLISNWTAYKILTTTNYKERVQKISYFIDVMRNLFEMKNYFDTMGILGGLDSNELFRMKVHFSLLPQADKDTLEKIQNDCTPDKQFANMRKLFDQAIESKQPSLPYIGVLLSDLFKFDDATQPFINGLMNIRKVKKVYQMISRIEEFSKNRYMYLPIDQVQIKLDNLKMADENAMFDLSIKCEPDGSQSELDLC